MATTALDSGNRLCNHRTAKDAFVAVHSGRIESMNGRERFLVRSHIIEVLDEEEYTQLGAGVPAITRKTEIPCVFTLDLPTVPLASHMIHPACILFENTNHAGRYCGFYLPIIVE